MRRAALSALGGLLSDTQVAETLALVVASETDACLRRLAERAYKHHATPKSNTKSSEPLPSVYELLNVSPSEPLPRLDTLPSFLLINLTGVCEAFVRREAAGVLFHRGKTQSIDGSRAVTEILIGNFRHANPLVRRACVDLMDHLADDRCVMPLSKALCDSDTGVRRGALHSLSCDACKPTPLVIDRVPAILERALRDSDARMRRVAVSALSGFLPDPHALDALHSIIARSPDLLCVSRAQAALNTLV